MELVAPLVAAMLGTTMAERPIVEAIARRKIPSRLGVEEFLRVCLSRNGRDLVVAPLPRGAGSITTLVRADALLRIPATSEGIDRDTRVRVELLPSSEPGDTVVVAGLPDLLSATVEDRLRSRGLFVRFAHLGFAAYDSMVALRNGEAHIAVFECTSRKQGEELDELEESYLPGAKRVVVVEPTSSKVHRVLVTETFSTTVNGTAVLSELESGNGRSTSQA
jgi:putative molybdopterin biosynthesis protein